jgi:uncharacterized protein YebE (UPF0316 family)
MDLLSGSSILVYVIIFFGKILEVSLDTLRIVMINRGKRLFGAILGFFVVTIWIAIISSVLNDLSTNLMKAVVYAVAYALGNYIGVTIENKLAIGLCSLMVITRESEGYKLANILRESGFGVTVLEGESANYKRYVLIVHLQRKCINEAVKLIRERTEDAVITVNDLKTVYGGFVKKR